MTEHKFPQDVIAAARRTLDIAWQGWTDYLDAGERRYAGLITAITLSRSVTNVLQNLKHLVEGFDPWWEAARTVLYNETASWFVELRNVIEKQGTIAGMSASVRFDKIPLEEVRRMRRVAPEGARALFLVDELGRNGWDVELPDGSSVRVYYRADDPLLHQTLRFDSAPNGRPIEELFPTYFGWLRDLVDEAERRFLRTDE
tara:strand:- start:916 stop:1518 length:603 start_codon:yes stop_codon:yes gene_type:complete